MRIDELERIRRYEALNRCRAACEKEVNVLERVVAELEEKHTTALERIRELEDEVIAYQEENKKLELELMETEQKFFARSSTGGDADE